MGGLWNIFQISIMDEPRIKKNLGNLRTEQKKKIHKFKKNSKNLMLEKRTQNSEIMVLKIKKIQKS